MEKWTDGIRYTCIKDFAKAKLIAKKIEQAE